MRGCDNDPNVRDVARVRIDTRNFICIDDIVCLDFHLDQGGVLTLRACGGGFGGSSADRIAGAEPARVARNKSRQNEKANPRRLGLYRRRRSKFLL